MRGGAERQGVRWAGMCSVALTCCAEEGLGSGLGLGLGLGLALTCCEEE